MDGISLTAQPTAGTNLAPCRLSSNVPSLGRAVTFDEYQQRAADCLRVAQETNDPTSKALLLEMAQAWINLAERTKRDQDDPASWTLPDPDKPKE
jgi:hypothetical protein